VLCIEKSCPTKVIKFLLPEAKDGVGSPISFRVLDVDAVTISVRASNVYAGLIRMLPIRRAMSKKQTTRPGTPLHRGFTYSSFLRIHASFLIIFVRSIRTLGKSLLSNSD